MYCISNILQNIVFCVAGERVKVAPYGFITSEIMH